MRVLESRIRKLKKATIFWMIRMRMKSWKKSGKNLMHQLMVKKRVKSQIPV
jgi:hypothetical protein